ncbi:WbqC family protein [Algoriphagus aestuariicola]|uniref:WbqC family protein n=1 Tax=Algoriphagus aestuariicola TaxID=1852016 RepID=A0ABS3BMI5_9BACT|nr:WbqC family protein [Algoriphagus aestuariicola]MBN7799446.1 WbqC family protein [Algoriphagus aestuariicola]
MSKIAIDLHYLPNLEFFAAIAEAEELLVFPRDRYQRQSYLNRTRIRLANKVETLSIPIVGRRPRIPLEEVKIDYSQKWQAIHLRGIQSAYGKAPFFEYFFPYFQEIFESGEESLLSLNQRFLTVCLKLLRSSARIAIASEEKIPDGVRDIRGQIEPGRPFSERVFYQPVPYTQLFGVDFEPNLGILDLLFCTGPEAEKILRESVKKQ